MFNVERIKKHVKNQLASFNKQKKLEINDDLVLSELLPTNDKKYGVNSAAVFKGAILLILYNNGAATIKFPPNWTGLSVKDFSEQIIQK